MRSRTRADSCNGTSRTGRGHASRHAGRKVINLRSFAAAAALTAGAAAGAPPVLAPPPQHSDPTCSPSSTCQPGQIAIQHLRIIDGTGAAPIEDATLLIDGAKIGAMLPAGSAVPAGYQALDGTGETAHAGPRRHAQSSVLPAAAEHRCSGPFRAAAHHPANDLQRAAPLPRQRRDDDAHDRERRALHRPQRSSARSTRAIWSARTST